MSNDMRENLVMPFLKILPWILAHPKSKRLPNGYNFGGRSGFTSLERFCQAWGSLRDSFPALITKDDIKQTDKAFEMLEQAEGK